MEIILVSATPCKREEFINMPLNDCAVMFPNSYIYHENQRGLPSVYNEAIESNLNGDDIIIFAHHDVAIEDFRLYNKVIGSQFDIIGLAGTSQKPSLYDKPILWNKTPQRCFSGAVAHTKDDQIWMTAFGPFRRNCVIIDGLFIAVKLQKLIEAGIRFDERFDFHFYDLDFCYQCHEAGLSIGTEPIWVVHSGLGDSFRSESFERNQTLFIEKWRKR
jgi:hypothetical protein